MRVRGRWAVRGVSIPSLPGVRLDCLRNSPLPRRPLRQVLASDCEAGSRAARPGACHCVDLIETIEIHI